MPYLVGDYEDALNKIADFSTAESWDNVGLLVGARKNKVKSAIVALDVTSAVIAEAQLLGANLIITHHPVIFPSIDRIDSDSLLYMLIRENINVICTHTNYDLAQNGVNYALCEHLGLKDVRVLESSPFPGLGRLGDLVRPMESSEFAKFVKEKLHVNSLKFTSGVTITTVAVCGGNGGALLYDAAKQAQALVTSEVKHHLFLEAAQIKFTLADAGHYSTEVVSMRFLTSDLISLLPCASISLSEAQTDPALYL